jgi:hypothetical protein
VGGAVERMEGDGGGGSITAAAGGCVGAGVPEDELCQPCCTLASCSKSAKSIAVAGARPPTCGGCV